MSKTTSDASVVSHEVFWRCLNTDGVDTCRYIQVPEGWELNGTAIFRHQEESIRLDYFAEFDSTWNSQRCHVDGLVGDRLVKFAIERSPDGRWTSDNSTIDSLNGLADIDLGFTPATNTNAIKRLSLAEGDQADTTALWLDIGDWTFKPLVQAYQRRTKNTYVYFSPDNKYQAELEVDDFGIVQFYPELWRAV